MPPSPPAAPPASPAVVEIERALTHVAYLSVRARRPDRLVALAGVPLDRAAVAMLRRIAEHDPLRPGELARLLGVRASHVTRQVQRLQQAGYVTRVPDPDAPRTRRIRLTPAGEDAVARLGDAGARGMQMVLAHWSPGELRALAGLFGRMTEVLLAASADSVTGPGPAASSAAPGSPASPGSPGSLESRGSSEEGRGSRAGTPASAV